ncbi:MAG: hypothetical protein ACREON_12715, partial [Gemmatimonadaceae bacterium]
MMTALLLAFQIAGPPTTITVKGSGSEAVIPVIETNTGPAIALEMLAPVIPLALRPSPTGRYLVDFGGVRLELVEQVPFAAGPGGAYPLAGSPFLSGGRLHVPLQVASELLPRLAPSRLAYDRARGELRLLAGAATVASGNRPASPGVVAGRSTA